MKKVLNNYREFINGRKKAQEDLENGMKALKKDYSGEYYDIKVVELKQSTDKRMNDLKNTYLPAIKSEYENTRKQIRTAITKPIPENIINVLNSMKGMTLSAVEKQELLNLTSKNYLARRQAVDILGNDYLFYVQSPESILNKIDELEHVMGNTTMRETYDFNTALMENGDWVNGVEGESSSFVESYL